MLASERASERARDSEEGSERDNILASCTAANAGSVIFEVMACGPRGCFQGQGHAGYGHGSNACVRSGSGIAYWYTTCHGGTSQINI